MELVTGIQPQPSPQLERPSIGLELRGGASEPPGSRRAWAIGGLTASALIIVRFVILLHVAG
jgi:hypothetical protein